MRHVAQWLVAISVVTGGPAGYQDMGPHHYPAGGPGGSGDIVARLMGHWASEQLGQRLVDDVCRHTQRKDLRYDALRVD
jgi:tripartite-type tricarboxylate transporter receptor subunit TctC